MRAAAANLRRNPWVGFGVVLLASFLILVDITVVNVAIPSIQRSLRAGYGEIELVVAGYQLAYAVFLITGGRLGDRYGRRRIFLVGLASFAIASLFSGAAVSGAMLVGARILQGASAAMLYPQVLSLIQTLFPPQKRSRAFALQGMVVGVAVGLGPLLGGVLIHFDIWGLGWRSIFLVNLPVVAIAIPAAWALIGESRSPGAPPLDAAGLVVAGAGLAALVFPLTMGRDLGWRAWVIALLASSLPLLLGLLVLERWRQLRRRPTLIELSLFGNRPFMGGLLATLAFFASLTSFSFTLSIFLQAGLRFSALRTGLVFIPFAAGILIAAYPASRFGDVVGKWAPIVGCGILVLGVAGTIAAVHWQGRGVNEFTLGPPLVAVGLGVRTVITPLFSLVLAATTQGETGSASGVLATIQRLGGAIGVAIVGLLFFGNAWRGPSVAFEMALLFNLCAAAIAGPLLLLLPRGRPDQLAQVR